MHVTYVGPMQVWTLVQHLSNVNWPINIWPMLYQLKMPMQKKLLITVDCIMWHTKVAQPAFWDPKLNSVTDVITVDIHEVPQVSLFTKKSCTLQDKTRPCMNRFSKFITHIKCQKHKHLIMSHWRRVSNVALQCLFVCLGFNGTFNTNRLYRAHHNSRIIYHVGARDNTNT